jgi:hypothetical protein
MANMSATAQLNYLCRVGKNKHSCGKGLELLATWILVSTVEQPLRYVLEIDNLITNLKYLKRQMIVRMSRIVSFVMLPQTMQQLKEICNIFEICE